MVLEGEMCASPLAAELQVEQSPAEQYCLLDVAAVGGGIAERMGGSSLAGWESILKKGGGGGV